MNTLNGSASPEPIQVGISEEFASKVTHLQDIMKKFNTDLRPNKKADICADCISSLKDILLEKESISASEEDIIGGDESLYLKFKYKAVIDGHKASLENVWNDGFGF